MAGSVMPSNMSAVPPVATVGADILSLSAWARCCHDLLAHNELVARPVLGSLADSTDGRLSLNATPAA